MEASNSRADVTPWAPCMDRRGARGLVSIHPRGSELFLCARRHPQGADPTPSSQGNSPLFLYFAALCKTPVSGSGPIWSTAKLLNWNSQAFFSLLWYSKHLKLLLTFWKCQWACFRDGKVLLFISKQRLCKSMCFTCSFSDTSTEFKKIFTNNYIFGDAWA